MDLNELRKQINSVDKKLLELLGERRRMARGIIEFKRDNDMPLRDSQREEDLLGRLIAVGRKLNLDAHFITRVFHEIIDDSVRSQQLYLLDGLNRQENPKNVAFQGIEGAYSHLAAQKFFSSLGDSVQYRGYTTFAAVVEAVEEGVAEFALLPVENTTAGNINDVYDLLSRTKLSIVGEEIFRVNHCLLAIDEVPVSRIRHVFSHPQALAQCARYLSQLSDCQADYFADTAMAVRKVKEDGDPTQAAIASEEAGRLYGLKILQKDLADQKENYTRFVVVAPQPIRIDPRIPSKTSLILATPHHSGALNKALDVLTQHGINMTKLDARPKPGSPFDYLFYIDFEGHLEEKRVQDAMAGLRAVTTFVKVLGSYPREQRGKTQPRVEALVQQPKDKDKATRKVPDFVSVTTPGRLYSRQTKKEATTLRVKNLTIGGEGFIVIAGPSRVESEEQIRKIARQIKESGGQALRGGCFRSGPSRQPECGSFEQLEMVSRVAREYELPLIAEIVAAEDVSAATNWVDILSIAARDMQNFILLDAVGKINLPVILERGPMASLEEFLKAAEYILEHGNHQVILCERGIRTFETITRNTLDLGAIPILKQETHLPLLIDTSHAAGHRDLVAPMALAARAVGPHGLIIELEPDPPEHGAGSRALDFPGFSGLLHELYRS